MDKVLISCLHLQRRFGEFEQEFVARGFSAELPRVRQQLSEGWLTANAGRFRGIIAGDDPFTKRVLERARRGQLEALVKWGVGTDAIDIEACRHLGIGFANTPGVFGDEVADVVLGYVLLLARKVHLIHQSVRTGGWLQPRGQTLRHKVIGIVGLGSIGRAVASRALAFGMRVMGTDIRQPDDLPDGLEVTDLESVLKQADFLVLACSLTRHNRQLLREETLGMMKRGAFVVNVARGQLVSEPALVKSLRSGRLAGAALDVFEREPLPGHSELRACDNCILGSHNGANTEEAVQRVNRLAVDHLFKLLGA